MTELAVELRTEDRGGLARAGLVSRPEPDEVRTGVDADLTFPADLVTLKGMLPSANLSERGGKQS